jgi:hypothetical protein
VPFWGGIVQQLSIHAEWCFWRGDPLEKRKLPADIPAVRGRRTHQDLIAPILLHNGRNQASWSPAGPREPPVGRYDPISFRKQCGEHAPHTTPTRRCTRPGTLPQWCNGHSRGLWFGVDQESILPQAWVLPLELLVPHPAVMVLPGVVSTIDFLHYGVSILFAETLGEA